ncbi:MAG: hypothetical protein HY080_09485 [Gammaproteobacteria bacterium]|nr:hypothetical protein [Gammaproteobacteria bacterium]
MPLLLTFLNLVLLVGVLLFLAYGLHSLRRRGRIQHALLKQHAASFQTGRWFRIRYANSAHFRRWLKLFPWHDSGILHLSPERICLYLHDDRRIELHPDQTRIRWHGQNFLPNGWLHWFSLSNGEHTHYLSSETGLTIAHSLISTRDIFAQLTGYFTGVIMVENPVVAMSRFAIEKNRHALISVIVFFIVSLYFLVDNFFVLQEDYVTLPPQLIFMAAAVLVLLAAYLFLERGRVPLIEKLVIALLLCLATAGALYPGLRRINQLTDSQGLQHQTYTFSATGLLIPQDPSLPRLTLAFDKSLREYWARFKPGDSYDVQLRYGGLGFYQINMAPIYTQMREYYTSPQPHQDQPG